MTDKIEDQLSMLLSQSVSATVLSYKEIGENSIALLDMSYREESGETHRTIRQTALLLEQDDLDFPDFTMRPKVKGLMGKLFKMLGNMSIEFEDSPNFSSAYDVVGWVEPAVRKLFVKPIRDHFAGDDRWSVCGHGKRLVIFQKNKVIQETEHDSYIHEGLEILSLFQMGEDALDASPELRRETTAEDVQASADRMGGMVGAALARQLNAVKITRRELEDFVASAAPRQIPAGMKRQVIGQVEPAIAVGVFITLAGLAVAIGAIALGEGNQRLIAVPGFFGAIFGAAIAFFVNRYRSGKCQLLRNGILHQGTITDVERTQTKVNEQRRHLVTVQADQVTAVCRAYGQGAKLANAKKDSGETVRFLVDSANPESAICMDLLVVTES